jgi:hypothetical protein
MQGRGRQHFGQGMRQFAGQRPGRQFGQAWNAGQRRTGQQGMRAGRGVGRGGAPMRQQRGGSGPSHDAGQKQDRLKQRIERLKAHLHQLESQLEIEQP